MSKHPQQTAYMYASSRMRALETRIVGRERIEHLADAASMDELYARLVDCGVTLVRDERGDVQIEPTLQGILKQALDDVLEAAPAPELFGFLRYPYDCHNIKSAIKSHLRGLSPMEMLSPLGTVSMEAVAKMPVTGDFSGLPAAMEQAAPLAMQAYAKTSNPRAIDLIIDKACYADMLASARQSGDELHVQLVRTAIDLTNLLICLRLVRMQAGEQGEMLLDQAMLAGGEIDVGSFKKAYAQGEDAVISCLTGTAYDKLAASLREKGRTAAEAERLVDDYRMELVRTVRYTTFGASVLTAYFYAQEYAIKNIRIVAAAKRAGLDAQTIRERIRVSYV